MERKGRGKLGKGAGKLPGRQRRCCCCRAPNHPAAPVDATPLSRRHQACTSYTVPLLGRTAGQGSSLLDLEGSRAQLFVAVAGRGGSLLEAGCSSSSPSRGILVAGEGRGWLLVGGGSGRRVGESGIWMPRADSGCVRTLHVGGVGSRSKENEMVVSWAGPYPN